MKFENLTDLIQVFANEYSIPGNIILIVGPGLEADIKKIFEFLHCESVFVSDTPGGDLVVDYHDFPFEESSFDIIINFTESDILHLLKPNGHALMKGEILNGLEYHSIKNNKIFTIL
jgi:hypothetical protein